MEETDDEERHPGLVDGDAEKAEVQFGEHNLPDASAQLGPDGDNIREIEWPAEVVLQQMSEYKYESPLAFIREFLTNSISSTLEAKELLGDSYTPLIHIKYYPHENRLVITDNGMGMSNAEIDEVGVKAGNSTRKHNPDKPGYFGIGLYSGFSAVGTDGGFFMYTLSRRTDEYSKGVWVGRGFADKPNLVDELDDDQYGIRFEFPLKDDLDVSEYVPQIAEFSRVPVLYTEHGYDGSETNGEDLGGSHFTANAHPSRTVVYEDEYVRIVTGNYDDVDCGGANGPNVVLLDVPIEGLSLSATNLPFQTVCVWLKQESARIVEGPHESMIRVSDSEYSDISDKYKHLYIPESKCTSEDIWTPRPAGDRDRLRENEDFKNWAQNKIEETYRSEFESILTEASEKGVFELDDSDIELLMKIITRINQSSTLNFYDKIEEETGREYSEEFLDELREYVEYIEYCPPDKDPTSKHGRERSGVWEALMRTKDGGDVFMSVRPTRLKTNIVWEDSKDNVIIRLKRSDQYQKYQQKYGWKILKEIDENNIDEFDVSPELKEQIKSEEKEYTNPNAGKDAPNRQITLHHLEQGDISRGYTYTTDWKQKTTSFVANEVYEHFTGLENGNVGDISGLEQLVLFPSNCDRNLRDYSGWLPLNGLQIATCAVKTYDYLKHFESVLHIDEYVDTAQNYELETTMGSATIDELSSENQLIALHYISIDDERVQREFRQPDAINQVYPVVIDSFNDNSSLLREFDLYNNDEDDDDGDGEDFNDMSVAYAPIDSEDLRNIRPVVGLQNSRNDASIILMSNETNYADPAVRASVGDFSSDTELYAHALLNKWSDSTEFNVAAATSKSLAEGGKDVIECYAALQNAGLPPRSEIKDEENDPYESLNSTS